jgi:hypothetical protein
VPAAGGERSWRPLHGAAGAIVVASCARVTVVTSM